ncbi:hypothetical protein LAZ67_8002378 [Cordylochernes scorpioides]|uniref:Reverse transcriptase domain-containing protein n=1 Tax=Cordylochernes scorpioides TaxID=51811 RepID=A0ABY6KQW1_9ARAC|nr:hypothetical protein LAZ67_8002378 [Cordylochernes scorpioides]
MNGHVLVGLSTKVHADRLIEDGLEIEETLLKAFPFRKRAEKVIISNLPLFVEDSEVMAALRPYGQITSIAPVFLTEGGFTFADSRREMFILLNEGMKLERLPLRLDIKSMGETLPAFLSYGVKCSRCQRQGHRRANCPLKTPAEVSGQAPSNVATPVTAPTGQPTPASPASSTVATAPASLAYITSLRRWGEPKRSGSTVFPKSCWIACPLPRQLSIITSWPFGPRRRAPNELPRLASINVRGLAARERSIELCHFLRQHRIDVAFVQETNTSSLDTIQDLCLGYLAAVVPPTAIRGSGLACIFAPGVAVLGQRILWPGHISIVSLDVHGQEVSVINCHLSHIPRERHQQLQIIAATAVQENSWVLGDLNINEESTNDTASGSVEALSELLDQTALVDVAILFDATHIPTRVASYGSRVDASRLDRILLPSSFSDRVVQYSTIHYRLSDHRAVLLQLGVPPSPRQPCVAAMLRSGLVVEHLATIIERTSTAIADMTGEDLWRSWSSIKTDLLAESCDSNAATEFIQGTTTPLILEDDDPLLRSEISATEIATAIRRLPLGRAPGWDDLPCEFYMAYEDFFVNALKRVYEASQLAGVLPTSTRRSTICLVPKSHGGPGLYGYRPISLPTTDYRILGNVLLRRLRPHLPVLVPQCQTYAVPGRSPSWNISRVRDEVDAAVRTGSPLAVISTDLESAFDTLDRGFLVSLMVSLRLPQVFIGWFLLLYSGADATVRAGGLHTKPFQLLNGVRQGCAISAAMFSLATSPLLRRLEQALGPGNVLAYADDIVLLIRSEEQFGVVTSIFENFRRASGIKGNFTKSKGLWCGAWRARNDAPLGISWSSVELKVLGCNVTPGNQNSAQERHILVLLEAAITRWSPYTRGLSLVGRARAANSLVLSSVVHHIHGYLPTDRTIHKIQARLARFIWGPERTAWFPGSVLARPVSLGGFGLIDIETQLRLSCFKGVQAALRGNRNAYSWLVESDAWLYPPPPGGCRLLRPPDLLAPNRWVNACIRDFAGPAPPLTRPTRCALADAASLTSFCRRLIDENLRGTYRVNTIGQAVVLRGTTTPFLRVITRTARRILERPRLTALPIIQFARRWEENINLPINIGWSSLRRCAFSGHNADVAVRLALHALPHPAHPASAHQSCIACGSGDLSLVHRYWSCRYIRPLIREAFTIIGRPPDLQGWVFGHGLDDDALAILASAKTRIYRHFLGAELRSVQEDPLLVWRRTLSRKPLGPKFGRRGRVCTTLTRANSLKGVRSSGSAGQEPGRPSIPAPTGGRISSENGNQKILKENSENRVYANPPAGVKDVNLAAARDVTLNLPAGTSSNGAARVLGSWADCIEDLSPGAEDDFTVVKTKKRRRESSNSPTAAAPSSNSGGARSSRRLHSSARSVPRAQEIPTNRTHITEARARQASSSEEHCVYLEHGPELQPFHYLRALDRLLGGTAGIIQISKVNGHQLLGLANRGLAERLINNGLEVEGTLLRAFPFRKRAERITVSNLPFFVEDSAIINALRPFGRITSIAPKMMKAGPYTYTDGRREAFIVLHEGMTTERLPTRLDITIKGEAWPAYLSTGIKCSRCHGQGHRRANCPRLAGLANNTRTAPPTTPAGVPPPTTPAPPQRSAAQPPAPTPSNPAMEVCSAPPVARAALHSSAPRPSPPAAPAFPMEETPPAPPPVTPAPSLQTPGSREPAAPTPDVEMSIVEETLASFTSSAKNATRVDLDAFIEGHPSVSFAKTDALGLGREEVLDLLSSRTKAQRKGPLLSPPQCDALVGLIGQILDLRPGAASNLYKVLGQVKAELRTTPAVPPTPTLPAPWPSKPTPPALHGEKTSPDIATPPPPLSTEFIDACYDQANDIIYELSDERYSEPLSDIGVTEGDIVEAIIFPDDREPLLRRLSTQKRTTLAGIVSAASERARSSDPFVRHDNHGHDNHGHDNHGHDNHGHYIHGHDNHGHYIHGHDNHGHYNHGG